MRIHGEIKAFVIASHCTPTHDSNQHRKGRSFTIRGLYQAVEIASTEPTGSHPSTVVNRENDMGLESLRHAKKALDPLMMVDKYRIRSPQ
jgi:uncharacterized protein